MTWRFKASKYKNATPIVPKPEACIRDICVGSYQTYGNNICASASVMAFNWEHVGSSLAILPLEDCGRKSKTMPLLHAHTDTITDMEFSPFHDGLLATGSQDCLVKIWNIPPNGLSESMTNAECSLSQRQRRVETVGFNPSADGLLHVTSATVLSLWDLITQQETFCNSDHGDVIQSASWRRDGRIMATSSKDKKVRIIDPRASVPLVSSAPSHQSIKDSRVVWLGDQNRILTTGFDSARLRQVIIRDVRNLSTPEKTLELDCSTGVLMPLYDPDTCMLFLAGKGDTTIAYMEVADRDPFLIEGIRHSGEQTKGACLVPKRALKVMEGEVNRVLQLTSSMVVPIMYQVPRKTYRDFHADLYPNTPGFVTHTNSTMWLKGVDHPVPKVSLDPAKRGPQSSEKPRLGPKPFSSSQGSEEFSFDKVFSVPAAPGSGTAGQGDQTDCTKTEDIAEGNISPVKHSDSPTKGNLNIVSTTPKDSSNSDSFASGEKSSPASDAEATPKDGEYTNGKSDNSVEEEANSSDSGYKPKTPSTAERRKMFEVKTNSKETPDTCVTDDAFDDGKNFERSGNQRASIAERRRLYENRSMSVQETASTGMIAASAAAAVAEVNQPSPTPLRRRDSLKSRRSPEPEEKRASVVNPSTKRTSTVFGRVSKFRHLKGTPGHKSTHIENLKNISRQISGECDGFHANSQRVAVPLGGGGGRVAVLELSATGRLADGVTPALLHPNALCDWQWDPFQDARLLVACDDGIVREWIIPEGGLTEPTNSPARSWAAHSDKIYLLKFHPCASDVVATAAHDFSVKLWDLSTADVTEKILLTGHKDQIFALAWSPCGTKLATVSKDGLIRIYQPRSSDAPIKEGKGPVGSRGARIVWALNGTHVVVTGFDKVSERQIMLFNASDLSAPLNTIGLDVSPAILIPFYDEDSSTLFVTGRGDSTIYCFEVTGEAPHLCALSHHRCASLHQGLSFLPKGKCAVEIVEFAKGFRLTNATIEPLSFAVPRIKSELFQDDLFPPTRVSWEPTVTSAEWFKGIDKAPRLISLKPPGMDTLSASVNPVAQSPAGVTTAPAIKPSGFSGNQPFNRLGWNPDMAGITKAKQDEIQRSLAARIEIDMTLEQDSMEGVDESEWDQ